MLIIGAKGFAKEILEVLSQNNDTHNLCFYDDINDEIQEKLYDIFPILKSETEAKNYFENIDNRFTLGIGNPHLRHKLYLKFSKLGGKFSSTISSKSFISSYDVLIGDGCNILYNAVFSNSVKIGKGTIVYYNAVITHDCVVGDFVEISPSANILGNVIIGNFTHIGANSTILPNIKIGSNVIVGAGAVVINDIIDNCVVAGVPAKIIKVLKPINP